MDNPDKNNKQNAQKKPEPEIVSGIAITDLPKIEDIKPANNPEEKKKELKDIIDNHPIKLYGGTLIAGFIAGISAFSAGMTIMGLETISKAEKAIYEQAKKNPVEETVKPINRILPPQNLAVNIMTGKPYFITRLEEYFSMNYGNDPNISSKTDVVEYQATDSFKNFTWSLETNNSYKITGIGFRMTSPDNFFQPLKSEIIEPGTRLLIQVPEINKGDRLIVVIRIYSDKELQLQSFTSAFNSVVK